MDKQKDLEEYVVKHKQEIDEMRNVCDGAFLVVELYDIVKLHKAGYRKEEQTRKETAEKFKALLEGTVPQGLLDKICKEITDKEVQNGN